MRLDKGRTGANGRPKFYTYPDIPQYDYTATGLLTVEVGCRRWPSRKWNDTPKTQLEQRLGEVTKGIVALSQETHAKELDQARRKEAYLLAVERHDFLMTRRADEIERFKQVEASTTDWEQATRLRAFADATEAKAKTAGELPAEQREWLSWVRAKADWIDPLVAVSDPILDAPAPSKPDYSSFFWPRWY